MTSKSVTLSLILLALVPLVNGTALLAKREAALAKEGQFLVTLRFDSHPQNGKPFALPLSVSGGTKVSTLFEKIKAAFQEHTGVEMSRDPQVQVQTSFVSNRPRLVLSDYNIQRRSQIRITTRGLLGGMVHATGEGNYKYPWVVAITHATQSRSETYPGSYISFFGAWKGPKYTYLSSFCTGALISPRWAVTAAHCVTDEATGNLRTGQFYVEVARNDVMLTEHFANSARKKFFGGMTGGDFKSTRVSVSRIIPHENYRYQAILPLVEADPGVVAMKQKLDALKAAADREEQENNRRQEESKRKREARKALRAERLKRGEDVSEEEMFHPDDMVVHDTDAYFASQKFEAKYWEAVSSLADSIRARTDGFDIALLELASSATTTNSVFQDGTPKFPVLADIEELTADEQRDTMSAGFGVTAYVPKKGKDHIATGLAPDRTGSDPRDRASAHNTKLLTAELKIVDPDECLSFHAPTRLLCIKDVRKKSRGELSALASGDSGGPFFCKANSFPKLLAVHTSVKIMEFSDDPTYSERTGDSITDPTVGQIVTKVYPHLDWMEGKGAIFVKQNGDTEDCQGEVVNGPEARTFELC